MKKSKIFLSLLAAGALATSCNDLDQFSNGGTATEEQKKEVAELNPGLVSASANALPQQLISFYTIFENHIDYGLPSSFLAEDCRGMDMSSANVGYNWYSPALEMSDFNGRYFLNLMCWYYNYYTIRTCNSLLASTSPDTDNADILYFRAQAMTFRAYCYFNLAQMYAFGYSTFYGNTSDLALDEWPEQNSNTAVKDLCVPVITDKNMDEAGTNGIARATVAEVYKQIIEDLTAAIDLFDRAAEEGVTRTTMAASNNTVKTFASATVAYALRARAALFSCKYTAAAADATKALELAAEEGLAPLSIELASVPGFTDITSPNYLWGTYADPNESRYDALVCWASHVTGFQTNGYAGAGVYRCINKALYESISTDDVRKKWWLDGSGNAPSSLPSSYANYIKSGYAEDGNEKFPAYAQVKFGAYQDVPSTKGCIDFPWMRVEELYLIKAEGEAFKSVTTGRTTLTDFVRKYRNPSFTCNVSDFEAFQDVVWNQRRLEFWGEGLSYADLQRLHKDIDRRGGGFPEDFVLVVSADDWVRLYDIPQAEIQRNPLIVDGTHGASQPQPVKE